jgi:hypothetical protein
MKRDAMKSQPFNKTIDLESNTQLYKKKNMVGNRIGKQKPIKYISKMKKN